MFPCTKCGCCCKKVNHLIGAVEALGLDFPYDYDETGRCSQLAEDDTTCMVYDHRPLACNIDAMIEHFKLEKQAAYNATIVVCNILMEQDNIPASFRIIPIKSDA